MVSYFPSNIIVEIKRQLIFLDKALKEKDIKAVNNLSKNQKAIR